MNRAGFTRTRIRFTAGSATQRPNREKQDFLAGHIPAWKTGRIAA
jgi:hypothetical protein